MKRILLAVSIVAIAIGFTGCKSDLEKGDEASAKGEFDKAAQSYQTSCDSKKSAIACNRLGALYERGKIGDYDYKKAFSLYEKACNANVYEACASAALIGHALEIKVKDALPLAQKACDNAIAYGCAILGNYYIKGSVEKDKVKGGELLKEACDQNSAIGCYILALIKKDGDPLEADKAFKKAEKELQKPCDEGYGYYCFALSYLYKAGLGVDQGYKKSLSLESKACDAKIRDACYSLALGYEYADRDLAKAELYYEKTCDLGDGSVCSSFGLERIAGYGSFSKNVIKGAELFKKGCDFNHAYSCWRLGDLYDKGEEGFSPDKTTADELYKTALPLFRSDCDNENDENACYMLGEMYSEGRGVKIDNEKAILYFGKSCDSRINYACYILGEMYSEGKKVKIDNEKAIFYYGKSCDSGDKYSCEALNKLKARK